MKRLLFVLFLVLSFAVHAFSGLEADKSPGDSVEIAWDFPVTAESGIDGFVAEKADDIAFTVNLSEVGIAAKTIRKITVIAGSTPAFYRVKSYKGVSPNRTLSAATNPVAVNIILKAPLGTSVK